MKDADYFAGFTLIEVLVALVVVSVGVLSLGGFSISMMGNGQVARERLTAVHLAEQVMEVWQHNASNFAPSIDAVCASSDGSAVLGTPITVTCTPASGVSIAYVIVISQSPARGPKPTDLNTFQDFTQQAYNTSPQVKLITVSWTNKGKAHQIYLTHLSKVK